MTTHAMPDTTAPRTKATPNVISGLWIVLPKADCSKTTVQCGPFSSSHVSNSAKRQYFNNKVSITTNEDPNSAGIYIIKNKTETIQNLSYNYNRSESNLIYQDISNLNTIIKSDSITQLFDTIKSDSKINELWKWFIIFALVFLIIEMLILKYFK